ncbi:SdpI family protein [Bacillus massilinigeriensis]|uniref:SdpI family protein n=1 Tax=Bacillus massilionigeriensis TaxID=1805475 RepID=UPI00096B1F6B|nr:SdpI family protein [Bacillus massilionigeriensis]
MRKHIFPLFMIIATIILWLTFYSKLPENLPTHWGASGEVDDYSSKLTAMLISVGLMVLVYVVLFFIPKIDPKKENYKLFSRAYMIINIALFLVAFAINILTISSGLGYDLNISIIIRIILGALLIIIGFFLPQIKPNYFMGIKTPWTLNDETNWKKTHHFGGKIFILSGIIFMCSIFLPKAISETYIMPGVIIILLLPVGYSYWFYKKQV